MGSEVKVRRKSMSSKCISVPLRTKTLVSLAEREFTSLAAFVSLEDAVVRREKENAVDVFSAG